MTLRRHITGSVIALVLVGCSARRTAHRVASEHTVRANKQAAVVAAGGAASSNGVTSGKLAMSSMHVYRGALEPDLRIVARLRFEGSSVRGSYFYETHGIDLELTGTLRADKLVLTERLALGQATGLFEGRRTPDGSIAGNWSVAFSAFNSQPHVVQGLYEKPFMVRYERLRSLLRRPSALEPLLTP